MSYLEILTKRMSQYDDYSSSEYWWMWQTVESLFRKLVSIRCLVPLKAEETFLYSFYSDRKTKIQKQPLRGVLRKVFRKYVANLQENTHAEFWFLRHGCSPVNLLHIFGTRFHKNTCGGQYTCFMWQNFFKGTLMQIWKSSYIF